MLHKRLYLVNLESVILCLSLYCKQVVLRSGKAFVRLVQAVERKPEHDPVQEHQLSEVVYSFVESDVRFRQLDLSKALTLEHHPVHHYL